MNKSLTAYLVALGRAIYTNNYLEWLIIEIIGLLNPKATVADLAAMEGGRIARSLREAIAAAQGIDAAFADNLKALSTEYDKHVSARNDIAHARPATAADGKQRLYRWDAKRGVTPYFVTDEDLARFSENAIGLNRAFAEARVRLKT